MVELVFAGRGNVFSEGGGLGEGKQGCFLEMSRHKPCRNAKAQRYSNKGPCMQPAVVKR